MKLTYTRDGKSYAVGSQPEGELAELWAGSVKVIAQVLGVAEASVPYLLQYGWAQSLQDSTAGNAKAVKAEMYEQAEAAGTAKPTDDEVDVAVKADIEGALSKRMDSIVKGTVGIRVGVSRDPLEVEKRRQAVAMIRKSFKSKNYKLPDLKTDEGRAKWSAIVAATLEKHADEITKKAKAALKAADSLPEVDLSEFGVTPV